MAMKKIREMLLLRFLKICTSWVEASFQDFHDDIEASTKFLEMIEQILGPSKQSWLEGLKKTFQKKVLGLSLSLGLVFASVDYFSFPNQIKKLLEPAPMSVRPMEYSIYGKPPPKPISILEEDSLVIANEIMLVGLRLLKEITARDLVSSFEEIEIWLSTLLKPTKAQETSFLDDLLLQNILTKSEGELVFVFFFWSPQNLKISLIGSLRENLGRKSEAGPLHRDLFDLLLQDS